MTAPVWGTVTGDTCPNCGNDCLLESVEEFSEGGEVECSCGWTLTIHKVEAAYKIELQLHYRYEDEE